MCAYIHLISDVRLRIPLFRTISIMDIFYECSKKCQTHFYLRTFSITSTDTYNFNPMTSSDKMWITSLDAGPSHWNVHRTRTAHSPSWRLYRGTLVSLQSKTSSKIPTEMVGHWTILPLNSNSFVRTSTMTNSSLYPVQTSTNSIVPDLQVLTDRSTFRLVFIWKKTSHWICIAQNIFYRWDLYLGTKYAVPIIS